jgi:hypothetical protein
LLYKTEAENNESTGHRNRDLAGRPARHRQPYHSNKPPAVSELPKVDRGKKAARVNLAK